MAVPFASAFCSISVTILQPPPATVLVDSVSVLLPDSSGAGSRVVLSPTVHLPPDTLKEP